MGYIGSMFGGDSGNEGDAGMNFKAGGTNVLQGVNTDQTQTAYNQTQAGLQQQQDFVNALKGQNGIGNQSSVFDQQQALAGQLQNVANGTGPNPALAQLQQTTGNNVATQAALMAGQRGAGANSGLLARQAAMQGANTQQQAVGQGATMAAQQQIAGMNALAGQQANMANLATNQVGQQAQATQGYNQAAQGQQANLLNGLGAFNNANVAQMGSQNSANASVAGVTAQNQGQFMNKGLNALGGASSMMGGGGGGMAHGGEVKAYAEGGAVNPAPSMGSFFGGNVSAGNAPSAPGVAIPTVAAWSSDNKSGDKSKDKPNPLEPKEPGVQGDAPPQGDAVPIVAAKGGMVSFFDEGGAVNEDAGEPNKEGVDSGGTVQSQAPQATVAPIANESVPFNSNVQSGNSPNPGGSSIPSVAAWSDGSSSSGGGGGGSSMMSMLPMLAMMAAKGGPVVGEQLAAEGKMVPGQAKVKGDSLQNDIVPARLSPGEVVIPRSVMQSSDPAAHAAKFVAAILAKNGRKGRSKKQEA